MYRLGLNVCRIFCELSGTRAMRKYCPSEKWELCTCNLCVLMETGSEEKGEPVGDCQDIKHTALRARSEIHSSSVHPTGHSTAWQGGHPQTLHVPLSRLDPRAALTPRQQHLLESNPGNTDRLAKPSSATPNKCRAKLCSALPTRPSWQ